MASNYLYIGTSGWHYKHWKRIFYPEDLKEAEWLAYYRQAFNTVEINNSFYQLPTAAAFEKWKIAAPEGFRFAVKSNRSITHFKKLQDSQQYTLDFIGRASLLEEKLGPILFQLPPYWEINIDVFANFVSSLPKELHYVFEFRNHSWYDDRVYDILRENNCAFCIYELAGHLSPMTVTADFIYVRLHGPGGKYQGRYTDSTLSKWSERCLFWRENKKTIYFYFDNDQHGYAVINARQLMAHIMRAN